MYTVGLVLAAVALGCPYDAQVSLGTPVKLSGESRLSGYWVWDDPEGKEGSSLVEVIPFNDAECLVEVFDGKNKVERFRAFQVAVGDQLIWNVQPIDRDSRSDNYSFARTAFTDSTHLSVMFVGEKGVPKELKSDAGGLVEYLKSHLTDPSLNDEDGAYVWRRPAKDEVMDGRLRGGGD